MFIHINQIIDGVVVGGVPQYLVYMLHAAVPLHRPAPLTSAFPHSASSYVVPWQVMSTGGPSLGVGQLGLAQPDYSTATPPHLSAQWTTVPVLGKAGKVLT